VAKVPGVEKAIARALAQKRSEPGVPPTTYVRDPVDPRLIDPKTLNQVAAATNKQWNIDETVKIVEEYQRAPPEGALLDAFSKWCDQADAVLTR
jgi:hypothetical protein